MVEKSLRMRNSFKSDTSFERDSAALTWEGGGREGGRKGGREGGREKRWREGGGGEGGKETRI